MTVQPGQTVELTNRLFAGAKEVKLLDTYGERYNIPLFDRAVDFGWFYFLTKPIFLFLTGCTAWWGITAWRSCCSRVMVKAAFFPLANSSYTAMSKMKALQPKSRSCASAAGTTRPSSTRR